jgi:hypothetical protein
MSPPSQATRQGFHAIAGGRQDRTTIRSICATAKQAAIDALAAAMPRGRGKTVEEIELECARAEIERLRATICEQAITLHPERGKDGWD